MTLKERVKVIFPELIGNEYCGGVLGCPHQYKCMNITEDDEFRFCQGGDFVNNKTCTVCWNQKYKEAPDEA